ncbi:MAG: hypothetical protein HXL55_04225 [Solobacterium sp.]|jgi:hypothetical protein|nr:hypothetical protein [Solobacterium sp.]MBF1467460.1 hypothetical protein [Prevotella pallens]DAJ90794.1 MAG TPA: Secretoglobin [Bacteriophage sp.]DAR73226.1 MAG TPA: Secretoglobin [Caudoviricetes sp.]DAS56883.1 MAG TPA: Secretoglobin [Caudoviricetes sp.]
MILIYPNEIKELKKIYGPYMIGAKLKDDAPIEAVEAAKKFKEWVNEQYRLAGME